MICPTTVHAVKGLVPILHMEMEVILYGLTVKHAQGPGPVHKIIGCALINDHRLYCMDGKADCVKVPVESLKGRKPEG